MTLSECGKYKLKEIRFLSLKIYDITLLFTI